MEPSDRRDGPLVDAIPTRRATAVCPADKPELRVAPDPLSLTFDRVWRTAARQLSL